MARRKWNALTGMVVVTQEGLSLYSQSAELVRCYIIQRLALLMKGLIRI